MTTLRLQPNTPDLHQNIFNIAIEEPDVPIAIPSALVAHENPDLRRLLRSVLTERLGMTSVIETDCLDAAIEHLAEVNGITLVVISLDLQGMESCVTVRLIREHFPGVRVVVVSSRRDRLAVLRPLAAGAHGHIDIATSVDDQAESLDLVRRGRVAVPSWLPDFRFEDD